MKKDFKFDLIEDALEDLKNGKMIMVVDDEDRENEGDLICAAEFATPQIVNFMASNAKGLICTPVSGDIAMRLNLAPMTHINTDNHCTAFTESVDHVDTTTGISAFERSLTMMRIAEEDAKPQEFRRPGHCFPLVAVPGGTLQRNGHILYLSFCHE